MNRVIELRPGEGNFYRAMAFHYAIVAIFLLPVIALLLVALLNPFWFRESLFNAIDKAFNRLSRWRNYTKYHIYLGCDPKVWHALKGDLKD
jgi:hypothetical protein